MNEDDFLNDIVGFGETDNSVETNVQKVKKGSAIRWIVPLILLVLVLVFGAVAASSSLLPIGFGRAEIVVFILSALLCNLVAASITLAGFKEYFTTLMGDTERIAADVFSVRSEQSRLQEALLNSGEKLADRFVVMEETQRRMEANFGDLRKTNQQTSEKIGTLIEKQDAQQQAVDAEGKRVVGSMSALAVVQGQLDSKAASLRDLVENVAGNITRVADGQATLTEALGAHAEALATQMASLIGAQEQLNSNFTHIIDEQSAFHHTLRDNTQVLTDSLRSVANCQQVLQTEAGKVAEAGQRLEEKAGQMVAEQSGLSEGIRSRSEELCGKMMALLQSQLTLHAAVQSLDEKANHAAEEITALAAEQAKVEETLQSHTGAVVSQIDGLAAGHAQLDADVESLRKLTQDLVSSVSDVSSGQAALHQCLQDNTQGLTDNIRAVEQNQEILQSGISGLEEKAGQMVAEQSGLSEGIRSRSEELCGKMMALLQSQLTLQGDVRNVGEKASQLTSDFAGVAAEQVAIKEALQAHAEVSDSQMTALAAGQRELSVGLGNLHELTRTVTDSTANITCQQAVLHETAKTSNEKLSGQLSTISENQRTLCSGINGLNEKATQLVAGIDSVANEQLTVQQLVQDNKREFSETMTGAAHEQQAMRTTLAQLQKTGQTVSDNIVALAETQDALKETLNYVNEQLTGGLTTLLSNHGQLHSDVNSLRELAQTAVGNVKNMAHEQAALNGTLHGSVDAIERNQKTLQLEVNTVAEATRQAAATVTVMAAEQARLLDAIRVGNDELTGQIAALSENQQAGLDELNAVTSRAASDLTAMNEEQGRLVEAIQAGREDLLTKLTAVAQDQYERMERFDTAQAKTHAIMVSLDTLEQNARRFEQTLYASIQDLTNLLNAEGQHRMQFEETVNQDLKAIADAVSLIGEIRASLEARMLPAEHGAKAQPTENDSQAMCHDISWAIEQLRKRAGQSRPGNNSENFDLPSPVHAESFATE